MKGTFIFILLIFQINISAQNLILNSSFEDTVPFWTTSGSGPECTPPWFTLLQSPDYLTEAFYYGPIASAPSNVFGYQYAKTGIGFQGFGSYLPLVPYEFRELIGYPFSNPLIANHNYYLEFYISCGDSASFALDGVGAYFSVDTPFINGWPGLIFTPQVHSSLGYVLNDATNWTKISGNFIAGGGEKVMTIGVLFPDSLLTIDTINTNTFLTIGTSYYYLDDVTLIDCTAVGMAEIAALDFQLLNNPVYDALHFTSYQNITNAYIIDMLGEIILQNEFNDVYFNYQINVATLPRGIYLLAVEDKNKIRVVRKFLKM
jgi:hypothetical protein